MAPLERAVRVAGWAMLDETTIDGFLNADGPAVLFFAGDPARRPEANDIAVILPELQRAFDGRFRVGLVAPVAEETLKARFDVHVMPTLALARGGDVVERIPRIKDWASYRARIAEFLDGPAAR